MKRFLEPYLSYRLDEKGGGIRDFGLLSTGGLLTQYSAIVFFVHGYNNDQLEASASYTRFIGLLGGSLSVTVIGVYWPGDHWTSGAYYMNALNKVNTIARRFARDIHTAALSSGGMEISFVAHSLGCRLTLETIRELNDLIKRQPAPRLKIRRIVFMAGAVPTFILDAQRPLNRAVRDLGVATKSLYSEADRILHYAFPVGQSIAGEGLLPTALGRTEWRGSAVINPAMQQKQNPGAGHSDYWSGTSKNAQSQKKAASEVRMFIPLGFPSPRSVDGRSTTSARPGIPGREMPSRRT